MVIVLSAKKKDTPKKSSIDTADKVETAVIALLFVILLAAGSYLYFFNQDSSSGQDQTYGIDFWYNVYKAEGKTISKEVFNEEKFEPHESILKKADEQGITVSEEEKDKELGMYVIENGISPEELESYLERTKLTTDDVNHIFETRVKILKFLEQENIEYQDERDTMMFDIDKSIVEEYFGMEEENQDSRNPEKVDWACREGEAHFFTKSNCKNCEESSKIFKRDISSQTELQAFHWELDTGDNLLTKSKEEGIPSYAVRIFKENNEELEVPALIVGCEYKKIGPLSESEIQETMKEENK